MDNLNARVAWAISIIPADKDLDWKISDVALGKILGTDKNTLARYRGQEGGLLKGEVIDKLVSHYGFSPDWLFRGKGEPFPGARAKYPEVCGPEGTAAIAIHEPSSGYGAGSVSGDAQKINIDEAMGKTYEILKSGTPYAVALYLNIQQFKSAVDTTRELYACQDRISNLETQVNDLRRQVDRLSAPPTTPAQPAASSEKEEM